MTVWLEIKGHRRRVDLPEPAPASGITKAAQSFAVDGRKIDADARMLRAQELSLVVEGRQYHCVLDGDAVVIDGHRFPFSLVDPRSLAVQRGSADGAGGPRLVKAPMPGRVVRVLAATGDSVQEHQGLIVIEAMKMQNELKSPKSGRLVSIAVAVGATVSAGDVLAIID